MLPYWFHVGASLSLIENASVFQRDMYCKFWWTIGWVVAPIPQGCRTDPHGGDVGWGNVGAILDFVGATLGHARTMLSEMQSTKKNKWRLQIRARSATRPVLPFACPAADCDDPTRVRKPWSLNPSHRRTPLPISQTYLQQFWWQTKIKIANIKKHTVAILIRLFLRGSGRRRGNFFYPPTVTNLIIPDNIFPWSAKLFHHISIIPLRPQRRNMSIHHADTGMFPAWPCDKYGFVPFAWNQFMLHCLWLGKTWEKKQRNIKNTWCENFAFMCLSCWLTKMIWRLHLSPPGMIRRHANRASLWHCGALRVAKSLASTKRFSFVVRKKLNANKFND